MLLLAGCGGYEFTKTEEISDVRVRKIETPISIEFCSALLEAPRRGCAIRVTNTETHKTNCVIVMPPGDAEAAAHEGGGHCLGYDHQ